MSDLAVQLMPLPNNDDLLQESATISAYGSPPASLDQEKGSDMSMSKTIWIPRRFWAHYVSLDAPLATRRDHLCTDFHPFHSVAADQASK